MPIEIVTAWIMLIALNAYVLFGGADFGAGIWDLLATGPRRNKQRDLLSNAIGPIWEANHVWLIIVVVLLFTCFPPAFAAIMTALHVPLTIVLLGIVARGASFIFRSYSSGGPTARGRWGYVFSIASLVTPVVLGVTLGTIASGELRWDSDRYLSGFFAPWLRLFPWVVGVFTLAIFAFLAAVYLCVEAQDEDLREDFRARAIGAGAAVGAMAALSWALAYRGAPLLSGGLEQHWWASRVQVITALAAIGAVAALWKRRFVMARALAVLEVSMMVLGYGAALFPYLVVPHFDITNSAAPYRTHQLILWALAVGACLLLPSLYFLFRLFKGRRAFQIFESGK
jgi:cytochrome d ubiquinol oxidase subunit II